MDIVRLGKSVLTMRNARTALLIGSLTFIGYLGWWWWSAWDNLAAAASLESKR